MRTYEPETLFSPDLSSVETVPLERRTPPRHRAIRPVFMCNHCSEPGLLLELAPTVTHEGGIVAACDCCAERYHGVSFQCFGRLAGELRGQGRRG